MLDKYTLFVITLKMKSSRHVRSVGVLDHPWILLIFPGT